MKKDYNKIPKIELHLHLDGSVRLETMMKLTGKTEKEIRSLCVANDCKDLKEYLTKFDLPVSFMQTKENIKLITEQLLDDLVKDNVIYAEIRFAPYLHTKGKLSYYDVISTVIDTAKENPHIKVNFILCMLRNLDFYENKKVIDYARIFLNYGVCAVDLAGDENINVNLKRLIKYAKSKNVPFTIHAGEVSSNSLRQCLKYKPKRIGHGIKAIEDDKLIAKLVKNKITLEICPTSNINTKAFFNETDLPIKKLEQKGVLITINTDNRTVSDTTLTKEYNLLAKTFDYDYNDFVTFNINAINASFLSEKEKEQLKNEYFKSLE